jgi:hypothetical protein
VPHAAASSAAQARTKREFVFCIRGSIHRERRC